jgi:hypothetical protein
MVQMAVKTIAIQPDTPLETARETDTVIIVRTKYALLPFKKIKINALLQTSESRRETTPVAEVKRGLLTLEAVHISILYRLDQLALQRAGVGWREGADTGRLEMRTRATRRARVSGFGGGMRTVYHVREHPVEVVQGRLHCRVSAAAGGGRRRLRRPWVGEGGGMESPRA